MVYLDNNATTRPCPEAVEAVRDALEDRWQNPSSVHRAGQRVRHAVELARADLAALIGVRPRELVFTSSGTESIDLAIRGTLGAGTRRVLATSAIEHAAVRDLGEALAREQDVAVRTIPAPGGVIDLDAARKLIDDDVAIVSVQWANNETGAIQPVEELGSICRDRGVVLHCDAVQWVGKMPCDLSSAGAPAIDLLTLSAHKLHGPKGIGGLWIRRGARVRPTIHGTHELGRRGGTENVPGILGAGGAARAARAWLEDGGRRERQGVRRDRLERAVLERLPDTVVNRPPGDGARLWNTTSLGFPGLEAEALLVRLSERGLCASAGAACSSGSLDPSPVLLAMGVPEPVAHGSIRLSLSRDTTEAEIDDAAELIAEAATALARSAPPR